MQYKALIAAILFASSVAALPTPAAPSFNPTGVVNSVTETISEVTGSYNQANNNGNPSATNSGGNNNGNPSNSGGNGNGSNNSGGNGNASNNGNNGSGNTAGTNDGNGNSATFGNGNDFNLGDLTNVGNVNAGGSNSQNCNGQTDQDGLVNLNVSPCVVV